MGGYFPEAMDANTPREKPMQNDRSKFFTRTVPSKVLLVYRDTRTSFFVVLLAVYLRYNVK